MDQVRGNRLSTDEEKLEYDENNLSQTPSQHEETSTQFKAQHDLEREDSASARTQTDEYQNHNMSSETRNGNENRKLTSGYLSMGRGKPYPPELLGENEAYLVDFDGPDDPSHPQNWPMRTRSVRANTAPQLGLTSTG